MSTRLIRIPNSVYRNSLEYKRVHMKREGFDIPIWKAVVETENEKKRKNGGFLL